MKHHMKNYKVTADRDGNIIRLPSKCFVCKETITPEQMNTECPGESA